MTEETFKTTMRYAGQEYPAEITVQPQPGREMDIMTYTVIWDGPAFVIIPGNNTDNPPSWILYDGDADHELIEAAGEAIERHDR